MKYPQLRQCGRSVHDVTILKLPSASRIGSAQSRGKTGQEPHRSPEPCSIGQRNATEGQCQAETTRRGRVWQSGESGADARRGTTRSRKHPNLGLGSEPAEGSLRYPRSRKVLILSDTGGSNGYHCRAWKTELQSQLADSFGLTLTIAHYPTGASKWNPIAHRLFSEISKNWAGEPLDSYQKILRFIRSTKTHTGLSVTAHLDRRNYPTGTEPPPQLQALRISPHEILPKWNYTISPNL